MVPLLFLVLSACLRTIFGGEIYNNIETSSSVASSLTEASSPSSPVLQVFESPDLLRRIFLYFDDPFEDLKFVNRSIHRTLCADEFNFIVLSRYAALVMKIPELLEAEYSPGATEEIKTLLQIRNYAGESEWKDIMFVAAFHHRSLNHILPMIVENLEKSEPLSPCHSCISTFHDIIRKYLMSSKTFLVPMHFVDQRDYEFKLFKMPSLAKEIGRNFDKFIKIHPHFLESLDKYLNGPETKLVSLSIAIANEFPESLWLTAYKNSDFLSKLKVLIGVLSTEHALISDRLIYRLEKMTNDLISNYYEAMFENGYFYLLKLTLKIAKNPKAFDEDIISSVKSLLQVHKQIALQELPRILINNLYLDVMQSVFDDSDFKKAVVKELVNRSNIKNSESAIIFLNSFNILPFPEKADVLRFEYHAKGLFIYYEIIHFSVVSDAVCLVFGKLPEKRELNIPESIEVVLEGKHRSIIVSFLFYVKFRNSEVALSFLRTAYSFFPVGYSFVNLSPNILKFLKIDQRFAEDLNALSVNSNVASEFDVTEEIHSDEPIARIFNESRVVCRVNSRPTLLETLKHDYEFEKMAFFLRFSISDMTTIAYSYRNYGVAHLYQYKALFKYWMRLKLKIFGLNPQNDPITPKMIFDALEEKFIAASKLISSIDIPESAN